MFLRGPRGAHKSTEGWQPASGLAITRGVGAPPKLLAEALSDENKRFLRAWDLTRLGPKGPPNIMFTKKCLPGGFAGGPKASVHFFY